MGQCESCVNKNKTTKGVDVSYGTGKKRHKLTTNKKQQYNTRTGSLAYPTTRRSGRSYLVLINISAQRRRHPRQSQAYKKQTSGF